MIADLLTEKLRPKKFEHLILSKRLAGELGDGNVQQNLLLYGPAGTGKTSAAKVLAIAAQGHADFYINCSDETGVDTVREKITRICSSMSVFDGEIAKKVVILDEIDGVSDQFFKALRGTMEKFTNTRFIATCNFFNKIPEPIQSRFQCVNFGFVNYEEEMEVKAEWSKRVQMVMGKLGISATSEALEEFVSRNFPDMRSALNKIQNMQIRGVQTLTADDVRQLNWSFEDLYKMLTTKTDSVKVYKFVVSELATKIDDAMNAIGSEFIDWIVENRPELKPQIPHIVIAAADYQAKRHLVIDPVVAMNALCYTVIQKTTA